MKCTYKVIDSKDKELKNNDEVSLIKVSVYVCTFPFDYLFQTMLEKAGIKIKSFKRL